LARLLFQAALAGENQITGETHDGDANPDALDLILNHTAHALGQIEDQIEGLTQSPGLLLTQSPGLLLIQNLDLLLVQSQDPLLAPSQDPLLTHNPRDQVVEDPAMQDVGFDSKNLILGAVHYSNRMDIVSAIR
jgi:hypothetical protein